MARRAFLAPSKAVGFTLAVLLSLQLVSLVNAQNTFALLAHPPQQQIEYDFSINVEINGQPFNIPVDNAKAALAARTEGQTLFTIQPRKGGQIWSSRDVTEFTTRINDEPVKIIFFPIRKITARDVRLYTQAFVDNHRQVTEEFWNYTELTPGEVDDVTFIQKLDATTFQTDNILGPRFYFDEPMVIYDRVVNGQHYSIAVTDMGFDRLGAVVFGVPEPSSIVLGLIAAVGGVGVWWRRRRRTMQSPTDSFA